VNTTVLISPAGDGKCLRLGPLAIRDPDGRADVPEAVPALGNEESSISVVRQRHVDRPPRFGRPRREFDEATVARRTTQPQEQLLDCEMARVGRLGLRITRELDPQRHPQGDADSLPCVHGHATAHASLQSADRHSTETDAVTKLGLRQAATMARPCDESALASQLLEVAARCFD
jgi:hypothetical protein